MENIRQQGIKQHTRINETDGEVQSLLMEGSTRKPARWFHYLRYVFIGIIFGITLTKSEVISWFRIQEMFRFQSFHMYGVIGTAIVVGMISVLIIKKFKVKTVNGEQVVFSPKKFNRGQIFGGLLFGFGWAMTGACPGPLFAQVGAGFLVVMVVLFSAIAGTWVYGYMRDRLPH